MKNINNLKKSFHYSTECCPDGMFEQTKNIHERLLRYNADSANVLHLLGGLAYSAGQFFNAIEFFKKAIESDPNKSEFYHDLGAAYYETGDIDKTISAFQHALYLNPASAETNKNLGLALYLKGNLDGAMEAFHRAVAANLNTVGFDYTPDVLFEENYNLRNAVANCHDPVALDLLDANIYLKIGNNFTSLDKSNEAIGAYLNAISIDPNCTDAYFHLGNLYKLKKDLGKAVAAYRLAISRRPNFAEAYHNLGATFVDLDRLDDAVSAFRCAVYINPEDLSAKYMLNTLTIRTAQRAPDQYIKKLFDQYSNSYETHMVAELKYRIPGLLKKILCPLIKKGHFFQKTLDLGCGTGLTGTEVRSTSKQLIGIDLSPKMISEARKKNLYDKLIVGEITEFLKETDERFDLVVAGDVFIYSGDLKPVFYSVKNRLLPGAHFIFSTENTEENGYILNKTGRFSHSKTYIFNLAKMIGFVIKGYKSTKIRKDREGWTRGDVYWLKYT